MDLERELEAERRRSGRLLSREEMSRPEDAATAESYRVRGGAGGGDAGCRRARGRRGVPEWPM